MSDDAGAADQAAFDQSICACMRDLDALLPELFSRYDQTVIVSAMAEHVGSALLALRRKNLCDDRQAELAIRHLERAAFPPPRAVKPKTEEPSKEGGPSQE
jgi:hypothetical protein